MIDHSQIKRVLAHRFPMLLVDAIESLTPWDRVVGVKCVAGTDPCFAHLPDDAPLAAYAYPVSLMIEAFGQACGVLVGSKRAHDRRPPGELMIAAGVTAFEVLRDVYPGDQMKFHGKLVKELTDFAVFDGEVRVGEECIARIDTMIVAFRQPFGQLVRPATH